MLDEVHERGVDSDFCLALILLALNRRSDLKLIIMSATISTTKFSLYLGQALGYGRNPSAAAIIEDGGEESQITTPDGGVPVLFIPGYTFPVEEFYRADFEASVYSYDKTFNTSTWNDGDDEDGGDTVRHRRKGDIDYDLILTLVSCLVRGGCGARGSMLERATGAVLVFMPGIQEITTLIQLLNNKLGGREIHVDGVRVKVMALHGSLSPSEQKKVFQPASSNELKIIVSTNVAEVMKKCYEL